MLLRWTPVLLPLVVHVVACTGAPASAAAAAAASAGPAAWTLDAVAAGFLVAVSVMTATQAHAIWTADGAVAWPLTKAVAKMTASTLFIVRALRGAGMLEHAWWRPSAWTAAAEQQPLYAQLFVVGMVFSWIGDLALVWPDRKPCFLAGLSSFLLAHVLYVAAVAGALGFTLHALAAACVLTGIATVVLWRWMGPGTGDMRVPVFAYLIAVLSFVTVALAAAATHAASAPAGAATPAWWSPHALVYVGALLFAVSDIFIARQQFVQRSPFNATFNLPMYFVAQYVLACAFWPARAASAVLAAHA